MPVFETVVVGADDSSTAREAVRFAADIAKLSGGKFHIVTAYDPKSIRLEDLPQEFRYTSSTHPADMLLQALSSLAKERGLEPVVHAATGDPADAVIRIAERENADLVVVGNKGMKGARRVLGSIPNTIAHGAPCSVLIVDTRAAG
jgi:nucleotide-binding universal stress UspA family protein